MKKILYLPLFLFVILLSCVLLFSACDGNPPADRPTDTTAPSQTENPAAKPEKPIEPTVAIGLKYTVGADKKTCTVTGIGTCKDLAIIISEYIDGYRVVGIGAGAFKNCNRLISVTLPASVRTVGKNAFENCTALREIVLPEGLTSIEKYAFENCSSLGDILLPETLSTIGAFAFKGCTALSEITVPASVTDIGKDIFSKATALSTVYYNSPYGSSGNDFLNTKSIKKIVFGGESVPEFICKKCSSLEQIIIEDTVKFIGGGAFIGLFGCVAFIGKHLKV